MNQSETSSTSFFGNSLIWNESATLTSYKIYICLGKKSVVTNLNLFIATIAYTTGQMLCCIYHSANVVLHIPQCKCFLHIPQCKCCVAYTTVQMLCCIHHCANVVLHIPQCTCCVAYTTVQMLCCIYHGANVVFVDHRFKFKTVLLTHNNLITYVH